MTESRVIRSSPDGAAVLPVDEERLSECCAWTVYVVSHLLTLLLIQLVSYLYLFFNIIILTLVYLCFQLYFFVSYFPPVIIVWLRELIS